MRKLRTQLFNRSQLPNPLLTRDNSRWLLAIMKCLSSNHHSPQLPNLLNRLSHKISSHNNLQAYKMLRFKLLADQAPLTDKSNHKLLPFKEWVWFHLLLTNKALTWHKQRLYSQFHNITNNNISSRHMQFNNNNSEFKEWINQIWHLYLKLNHHIILICKCKPKILNINSRNFINSTQTKQIWCIILTDKYSKWILCKTWINKSIRIDMYISLTLLK